MSEYASPTTEFERTVLQVLARHGFAAPPAAEACVLLFDCMAWASQVAAANTLLDDAEHGRADRFRFEHDRTVYIVAHALWRIVLGACAGIPGQRVPLISAPSGQPLVPGTGLATSISHSGPWVTIAVTSALTVGVDIERSPSRFALDPLLPNFCAPEEIALLAEFDAPLRAQHALKIWTRKEALLKAVGIGLALDPSSFAAPPSQRILLSMEPARPACIIHDLELDAPLIGALAMPGAVCRYRLIVASSG